MFYFFLLRFTSYSDHHEVFMSAKAYYKMLSGSASWALIQSFPWIPVCCLNLNRFFVVFLLHANLIGKIGAISDQINKFLYQS